MVGYDLAQGHNGFIVSAFDHFFGGDNGGAGGPGAGGVSALPVVSPVAHTAPQESVRVVENLATGLYSGPVLSSGELSSLLGTFRAQDVQSAVGQSLIRQAQSGVVTSVLREQLAQHLATSNNLERILSDFGSVLSEHVKAGTLSDYLPDSLFTGMGLDTRAEFLGLCSSYYPEISASDVPRYLLKGLEDFFVA